MLDKAVLGTRYTCFQCRTKFYDLNRPEPTCPECNADQREAPVRDLRALLGKGGPRRPQSDARPSFEDLEEEGEDDDLGLLGDDDDDDDDDDEEEEEEPEEDW